MHSLHPAPVEGRADHRSSYNRQQMNFPSELVSIWDRVVRELASDLQIDPIEAHSLLSNAANEITLGVAWELFDRE